MKKNFVLSIICLVFCFVNMSFAADTAVETTLKPVEKSEPQVIIVNTKDVVQSAKKTEQVKADKVKKVKAQKVKKEKNVSNNDTTLDKNQTVNEDKNSSVNKKVKKEKNDKKTKNTVNINNQTKTVNVISAEISKNSKEIDDFILSFEQKQNKHNLIALKKLYTDDFVNNDGFNKAQLFKLMDNTYKSYPDLKNSYKIIDKKVNKNFAIVNVAQTVNATTKAVSKITDDNGQYVANLNTIFYLKKINNEWKIYSENVIYENSRLAFGDAKNFEAYIIAPQRVLADTDYCAGVNVVIPKDYTAVASINNTQVVEDFNFSGEKFRQVDDSNSALERVLKANSLNNNEAVVISVGFTKSTDGMFKKRKIDMSGLLLLMQRVDVIPANSNLKIQKENNEK